MKLNKEVEIKMALALTPAYEWKKNWYICINMFVIYLLYFLTVSKFSLHEFWDNLRANYPKFWLVLYSLIYATLAAWKLAKSSENHLMSLYLRAPDNLLDGYMLSFIYEDNSLISELNISDIQSIQTTAFVLKSTFVIY